MGLNAKQLRELVVRPALKDIGVWSQAAENLVMGTAAQESDKFRAIKQYGNGPALGLFQVEPATYYDYWENYLNDRPVLSSRILSGIDRNTLCRDLGCPEVGRVVYDLRFAAMMCRVHYLRIRAPLPDAEDVHGLAAYWKKYYNTVLGKGTTEEFVNNYRHTKIR